MSSDYDDPPPLPPSRTGYIPRRHNSTSSSTGDQDGLADLSPLSSPMHLPPIPSSDDDSYFDDEVPELHHHGSTQFRLDPESVDVEDMRSEMYDKYEHEREGDDDDYEEGSGVEGNSKYNTIGNMSLPPEQRRFLSEMESSFRVGDPESEAHMEQEQTLRTSPLAQNDDEYAYEGEHEEQEHRNHPNLHQPSGRGIRNKGKVGIEEDHHEAVVDDNFSMVHPEHTPNLSKKSGSVVSRMTREATTTSTTRYHQLHNSSRHDGSSTLLSEIPLSRVSRSSQRRRERLGQGPTASSAIDPTTSAVSGSVSAISEASKVPLGKTVHTITTTKTVTRTTNSNKKAIGNKLSTSNFLRSSSPTAEHEEPPDISLPNPTSDVEDNDEYLRQSSPIVSAQMRRVKSKERAAELAQAQVQTQILNEVVHKEERVQGERRRGKEKEKEKDREIMPPPPVPAPKDKDSKVQRSLSNSSARSDRVGGSTMGSTIASGRRPRFLRSRRSSARSSISSVNSNPQDASASEDEGVSTIVEESIRGNQLRNPPRDKEALSRSTSLGSIASGVTGLGTNGPGSALGEGFNFGHSRVTSGVSGLEVLDQGKARTSAKRVQAGVDNAIDPTDITLSPGEAKENENEKANNNHDAELAKSEYGDREAKQKPKLVALGNVKANSSDIGPAPVTPTNSKPPLLHPTFSTLTTQVQQIQVPHTIAREIRSKHPLGHPPPSTSKRPGSHHIPGVPHTGTTGKNMTLKEQSAIIDRLQKENFDLKIKVYYLNERLEKTSEEGVAEVNKENMELKLKLAEARREIRILRKELRDLKKEKGEHEEGEDNEEEGGRSVDVEVVELRERCERYQLEIERLRRRLAGEVHGNDLELLKDLLENETLRREQAERENERLREEIWQLRNGAAGGQGSSSALHPPPTITRRTSMTSHSDNASQSGVGIQTSNSPNKGVADASLITRLKMENEELRREVGAQTSMLTSRNREKERLYQEIEELKINLRSAGSVSDLHRQHYAHQNRGEFQRQGPSAMSEHDPIGGDLGRSLSRVSHTPSLSTTAVLTENERDDLENQNGVLRDKISELKLKNQEFSAQLEAAYRELDEYELRFPQIEQEYTIEIEELINENQQLAGQINELVRQRDEALADFDELRAEAEEELARIEEESYDRAVQIERLEEDIRKRVEDFEALQGELRNVSEMVVGFEDAQDQMQREAEEKKTRLDELDRAVQELEQENDALEKNLVESKEMVERLTVQLESAQGEISFLREEQDSDKIKIGILEDQITKWAETHRENLDMIKDLEKKIYHEKKKSVDAKEKEKEKDAADWERKLAEKAQDLDEAKEEIRRLNKRVGRREEEASKWRVKLQELENALRSTLGDPASESNLLDTIKSLQKQLEQAMLELSQAKSQLTDKERTLRDRENLLESMALESKKLGELLEKERVANKAKASQLESLTNSQHQTKRAIVQHQSQISELEMKRNRDGRSLVQLENHYKEQLSERNNLLITIWVRLSAVCGPDWSHRNGQVVIGSSSGNGGKITMEAAVATAFASFSKNLMAAVKTIEAIVAGFKMKCKNVERDLWKEYQTIENALESRTKRIDRLETLIRGGIGESSAARTEVAKLRTENRLLKAEINVLRSETGTPPTGSLRESGLSPGISRSKTTTGAPMVGPHGSPKRAHTMASTNNTNAFVSRTQNMPTQDGTSDISSSTKTTTHKERRDDSVSIKLVIPPRPDDVNSNIITASSNSGIGKSAPSSIMTATASKEMTQAELLAAQDASDKRWILRLRELEKRLKAEREARLLDRSGAKKRLEDARVEREALQAELERERENREAANVIAGVQGPPLLTEREEIEKEREREREREREKEREKERAEKRERSKSRDGRKRDKEKSRERSKSRAGRDKDGKRDRSQDTSGKKEKDKEERKERDRDADRERRRAERKGERDQLEVPVA